MSDLDQSAAPPAGTPAAGPLAPHGAADRGADKPLLSFQGVGFSYDQTDANANAVLRDISFDVWPGEFVMLLGRSGCGKSTLMNLTAGLEHPTAGSVVFAGAPLRTVNTQAGYMTQGDTLPPCRTVEQNLRLPAELRARRNIAGGTLGARIQKFLALTNLTEAAKHYPSQLSGGMKRRALLVRSLIYEPQLLLMDEPFAALDAQMRATMHQELLTMVRRLQQTVLFITHDIHEAIVLSDRVVTLHGRPSQVRAVTEIPFGPMRDPQQISNRPEFAALSDALWQTLRLEDDA